MHLSSFILIGLGCMTLCGCFDACITRPVERVLLALICVGGVLLAYFEVEFQPTTGLSVYPCALLLFGMGVLPFGRRRIGGVLLCAVFGGLIGWKLLDRFPLFSEPGILIALPTLILCMVYQTGSAERLTAVVLAPLVAMLVYAAQDLLLYGYARVMLGSAEAADAQAIGVTALLLYEAFRAWRKTRSAAYQPKRNCRIDTAIRQ